VGGFSVGQDFGPRPGIILHYDGSQWTEQQIPVPGLTFSGVWTASPTAAFAVGSVFDTQSETFSGVIYRYNGSSWTALQVPATRRLNDVWGTSDVDVYAVGEDGILHYDGVNWSYMKRTDRTLYDIWGSSPADAFAVGSDGLILRGTP
jgi:hypothetical protein